MDYEEFVLDWLVGEDVSVVNDIMNRARKPGGFDVVPGPRQDAIVALMHKYPAILDKVMRVANEGSGFGDRSNFGILLKACGLRLEKIPTPAGWTGANSDRYRAYRRNP